MQAKIDITLGEGLELVADARFELGPGQVGRWRASARGVLARARARSTSRATSRTATSCPRSRPGNCVVVKPSEKTPATGQLYAELAAARRLPARASRTWCRATATVGARLAAHPALDGVLFTGSYAAGRRILEATLDQPWKLVALEMGGKNGVLVCADADLDAAAHAIAFGACVTSGQRCSATEPRVRRARGRRRAVRAARAPVPRHRDRPLERPGRVHGPADLGAPRASDTRRCWRWAAAEGAEALVAGGPCDGPRPGHYVRPSLHRLPRALRAERAATRARSTSCPTRSCVAVDSVDEGLARARRHRLRPGRERVHARARRLRARRARAARRACSTGTRPRSGASSKLPFGGVKRSGNDRAGRRRLDALHARSRRRTSRSPSRARPRRTRASRGSRDARGADGRPGALRGRGRRQPAHARQVRPQEVRRPRARDPPVAARCATCCASSACAVEVIPPDPAHPGPRVPRERGLPARRRVRALEPDPDARRRAAGVPRARSSRSACPACRSRARFEGEADLFPAGDAFLFTHGRIRAQRFVPRLGWPPWKRVYGFRSDPAALAEIEALAPARQARAPRRARRRALLPRRHLSVFVRPGPRVPARLRARAPPREPRRAARALRRAAGRARPTPTPRSTPRTRSRSSATASRCSSCRAASPRELADAVRATGTRIVDVDVSEFHKKGGGSVKCMIGDLGRG